MWTLSSKSKIKVPPFGSVVYGLKPIEKQAKVERMSADYLRTSGIFVGHADSECMILKSNEEIEYTSEIFAVDSSRIVRNAERFNKQQVESRGTVNHADILTKALKMDKRADRFHRSNKISISYQSTEKVHISQRQLR